MPPTKQSNWKKLITFIKDIKEVLYITTIIITVGGWIITNRVNKKNYQNEIINFQTQITDVKQGVDGNTKQLEKITDILLKQAELNGQIIQHIKTDK